MVSIYKEYDIYHVRIDLPSLPRCLLIALWCTLIRAEHRKPWSYGLDLTWWCGPCPLPWVPGVIPPTQTDSKKFINQFWKSKESKLDMQATHDGDAHHLPWNKTLSMAEVLEINNSAILIRLGQADSTIGKNVIIGEPREPKKGIKSYIVRWC